MKGLLRLLWQLLLVRPLVWGLLGVRARHRERLPRKGPAIVVANHNSHLDAPALMALFPVAALARLRPVAARDFFTRDPLVAWLAFALSAAIPLRRTGFRPSDGDPLGSCSAALARGEILILFPEGTRGEPERMGELKPGIAHLARRYPDVPIVPVFLHGLGRSLPRGSLIPLPLVCDAFVGRTLRWTGDREGFMESLRARFANLARMREVAARDGTYGRRQQRRRAPRAKTAPTGRVPPETSHLHAP